MLQRVHLSAMIACTNENHEFGLNEQEASTKILSRHRVEIRYRKVRNCDKDIRVTRLDS